MLFDNILQAKIENRKLFAVLIDPEKCFGERLIEFAKMIDEAQPDFVFVGGSQLKSSVNQAVETIKDITNVPVVIFPGNAMQTSENADAILFLSLISGRNAEFLIGQHVKCAMEIKNSGIEVIPVGYILIDGKKQSAAAQVSETEPLNDLDEIVKTAVAGELLSNKMIYLEAGSGAKEPVNQQIISEVRENISIPLIVGGGLSSVNDIKNALKSGADLIVIGNFFEKMPEKIFEFCNFAKNFI